MEPETGAAAKGKDTDDDQNNPDPSSLTGKKEDQRQQILMDTEDTNWYKNTQALKYLQPVFMPIVKDKMKSLQLQCETDFGRQLCAEATADDIILVNGSLAKFKHLCPGTVVACQTLLNIIKEHTSDSVNFYQMLKGTDPQNWLKSPFEFVRLFLKDWMRCDIHDFQKCDITALCTIVKRCKPLMQIFDERKIDDLRKVRNRTMHPATMSISQQEMENNIDVILDFLEHIKSLKSTDEVNEAIESIKQLKTGDVRLLHSMVVRLIQGWLPGARIVYEHKCDQAKNQLQDIIYMEKKLSRLSSGQEITTIKQSAEHEFGAKTERLTDESQKLKLTTEELAKEKEKNRKLENQNEELRKLRQEEKRESEEQIKKLKERLETIERRSLGEVCLPKEISTQRSPDLRPTPATVCSYVSTIPVKSDKDKGPCYKPGMAATLKTPRMLADEHTKYMFGLPRGFKYDVERELEEQYEWSGAFQIQKEKNRELKKQMEELRKHLTPSLMKRAAEKRRNAGPRISLETIERRNLGKVCLPKEISTQRSAGDALEVEEPYLIRVLGGERFPTQALSASTSSGDEHETVKKEVSKPQPLFHASRMTFPTLEKLHLEPSPATGCSDVSTIFVKSHKDKGPCYITGMVAISGTQLMLADDRNECIKLLDLERRAVIRVKELPSAPHDVTYVPGSRVAVTIPAFQQIHVFTTDQNLNQCGIMSVNGECLGIHCSGDRFFVSCKHPPLVQILNMDGGIIKTIQVAPIEYPMYLTCSPDNKFIYVSDFYNDTVTCMDMAGSVQWRYNCKDSQSAGLTLPQGVCTGDGCIYICSFDDIHVVSPTGTKLAIIPFRMTGAKNAAVCYNSQDRTLYVSPFPSVAEENAHIIRIRIH